MDVITLTQEIFFDLCDLLEENDLEETIDGFDGVFHNLRSFVMEQKVKIAEIERQLTAGSE